MEDLPSSMHGANVFLQRISCASTALPCLTLLSPTKTLSSRAVIWLPDSSKISSLFILTSTSGSFVKLLYLTRKTRRCCSSASSSGRSVSLLLHGHRPGLGPPVCEEAVSNCFCCDVLTSPGQLQLHHMRIVLHNLPHQAWWQGDQSSIPAQAGTKPANICDKQGATRAQQQQTTANRELRQR